MPSAEAEKGMASGTRSVPATFHAVNGYPASGAAIQAQIAARQP